MNKRKLTCLGVVWMGLLTWSSLSAQESKLRTTLEGHKDLVSGVAFNPDGKTLASVSSSDGAIKLWDLTTGKEHTTLKTWKPVTVAFSPDGKTLAVGSSLAGFDQVRNLQLLDVPTGKGTFLFGHSVNVTSVAFSPDSKILASASADQSIKLWDVDTGKERVTLKGHTFLVTSVAFSPDGKVLASGSWDESIKLWDVDTGKERATLGHRVHVNKSKKVVNCVVFSPDGKMLASGS